MKKVTKKEIVKVLRGQNSTEIFKIAAMSGVDVSEKGNVFNFIQKYAPSNKVYGGAYRLSYGADWFKNFRAKDTTLRMPIKDAIEWAKWQKDKGLMTTIYAKILIEGNTNIYWASPVYGHSDYNKSVAFENNGVNRKVAQLINKYLA